MRRVRLFRYWPVGEPVPEGWRVVKLPRPCHHCRYSLLLEFKG